MSNRPNLDDNAKDQNDQKCSFCLLFNNAVTKDLPDRQYYLCST